MENMKNKKMISFILAAVIFLLALPSAALNGISGFVRILVEPSLVYDAVYSFRDGMAWVKRDGKVGFVNKYGEVVIPIEFDAASHFFSEGLARAGQGSMETGFTYGFIDKTGALVIPYEYGSARRFINGSAYVSKDGRFGYIDASGQITVPLEYDWITEFTDGLAIARKGGFSGVIDNNGNSIIPFDYTSLSFAEDGLINARHGDWQTGKAGILDRFGNVVVPFEYDWIDIFYEGLAAVRKDDMLGFIDITGNVVIPFQYGSIGIREEDPRWRSRWAHRGSFEDGFAVISKKDWENGDWESGNEYGLIDRTGNVMLPFEYDVIYSFSEGLAVVGIGELRDGEWGLDLYHTFGAVDTNGNLVVPFDYESVSYFLEGVASARKDGKAGLIDTGGNVVIPFEYNWIGPFTNGVATVSKDGKNGLIDSAGNIIIPIECDWLGSFSYDWFNRFDNAVGIAGKDGKTGLLDNEGNTIIAFEYDRIWRLIDGVAFARKGNWSTGTDTIINISGNTVNALPLNALLQFNEDRNNNRADGLFWIYTGDSANGFQYGILEINTEYVE